MPSGFAGISLSALTSAFQFSAYSAAPLARDVVTASNPGGPAVVLAPGATAPPPLVEGAVPTAIGAVLDALDSVSKVVDAAPVPVIPPIGASPASQASGAAVADVGAWGTSRSIDVPATISASIALPPIAPAAGNLVTDLVRAIDDASDASNGGASAGSGGSRSGGEGVGISIASGPGLVGAEISTSASSQGLASTLAGLGVDVKLPASPLDPTGGSPVPNPPSDPTLPPSPGNPTAPTIPTAPTAGSGSTAAPLPSSGRPGAGASTGASPAPSTGSTAGGPAQADGSVAGAQSAAFFPNGGSAASPGVLGASTAHEAASSPTGPSISPTVSAPTEIGAAMGQGRLEDERGRAASSSFDAERPTGPQISPAELLPGDLESLERALAQLMRRLDRTGEDLAGWFAQSGVLEMLVAAGMVVLASEVFRRWERRRRLAMPRGRVGSSGRPGPFYRPRAYPFGRPGSGRRLDRPVLI